MSTGPQPLFAVVNIEGTFAFVLAGMVLLVVVAFTVAVIWFVRVSRAPSPDGSPGLRVTSAARLPVSKGTFDILSKAAATAVSRPEITPERQAFLKRLDRTRGVAARTYRGLLIAIGLVGLAAGISLFRQATPANLLLLPALLVLLLSMGALLSGVIPSGTLADRGRPVDRALLQKIHIGVQEGANPLRVKLEESDIQRAAESLRLGLPLDDIARSVYSEYDRLEDFEKDAIRSALKEAVRRG